GLHEDDQSRGPRKEEPDGKLGNIVCDCLYFDGSIKNRELDTRFERDSDAFAGQRPLARVGSHRLKSLRKTLNSPQTRTWARAAHLVIDTLGR
ncbi:MAG TPA: hypothetical protein VNB49_09355, partial [Candidatus Dormibacteraeota bacterium]|nr:hypothetical protein [Candidatus Dormibacteraeota bacterium]